MFGLYAGALSDRLDRRLLVVTVNKLRAAVLAIIAASILTGTVSVGVVLVALFLLGTAEVFADNTSQTLAQLFGVTAPFWFAFAGSAVFVVLIWRQLAHIAHADARGN